jgi:hypothetical protein
MRRPAATIMTKLRCPGGEVDRSSKLGLWRSTAEVQVAARASVLSTALAESTGSSCTRTAISVQSRRRVPISREVPLQALAYGHCGKKFAAKVPGEGIQSPAPGADTETFV